MEIPKVDNKLLKTKLNFIKLEIISSLPTVFVVNNLKKSPEKGKILMKNRQNQGKNCIVLLKGFFVRNASKFLLLLTFQQKHLYVRPKACWA